VFDHERSHCGDTSTTDGDASPLVAGGVTALTLGVAVGLLALDVDAFWVAFPVGFGVVLPGAVAVAHGRRADERRRDGDRRETGDRRATDARLAALRRRYAAGELSDGAFERRIERLVESEEGSEHGPAVVDER
jgi:uncharacterized membrane protein